MDLGRAVRRIHTPGLAVLGLTAFSVTQPLLDVLASNAEFFVVQDMTAGDVVRFALTVYLVPALLVGVAIGAVWAIRRAAGLIVLAVVGGLLTSVAVASMLPDSARDRTGLYLALVVAVALAAGWAFLRTTVMIRFWRVLGVISPLVVISFLFFSPASDVVLADEVELAGTGARADDDVVVIVFDEFSMASVLDESGRLDPAKAPNFVRLAEQATFYPNATTTAADTAQAVPSVVSGQRAELGQLPLASEFPQSLFTVLAPSHDLHVFESQTDLCPPSACGDRVDDGPTAARVYNDARIVYLHRVLPTDWARRWLPDIADRWAGFGESDESEGTRAEDDSSTGSGLASGQQTADAEAFIASLAEPATSPRFDYGHLVLPHVPYRFLPDGRRYNGGLPAGLGNDGVWTEDRVLTDVVQFQYQLQVGYADELLGRMLDALREGGRFDRSMIVVVADHGVVIAPGHSRRDPERETLASTAWVPMFVKLPQQRTAEVDGRPVQTMDIFPTVAEALDVTLAEPVDGHSLLDPQRPDVERYLIDEPDWDLDEIGDLPAAIGRETSVVPSGTSPMAAFGTADLRGRTGELVEAFPAGTRVSGRLVVDRDDQLVSPGPDDTPLPLLLNSRTVGLEPGDHVAVVVGGRLAGSGLVTDKRSRLVMMLDPEIVEAGGQARAYLVVGERFRPMELERQGSLEATTDGGAIVRISDGENTWTRADHPGDVEVWPNDQPEDPRALQGWATNCDADRPEPVAVVVIVDDSLAAVDHRTEQHSADCLTGPAPIGFALQVPPLLTAQQVVLDVAVLFDDGTFAVVD